jgi:hypothetical protein
MESLTVLPVMSLLLKKKATGILQYRTRYWKIYRYRCSVSCGFLPNSNIHCCGSGNRSLNLINSGFFSLKY